VCACIPPAWKLYHNSLHPKLTNMVRVHRSAKSSENRESHRSSGVLRSFGSGGKKKPVGDLTNIVNMKMDVESTGHGTVIDYDVEKSMALTTITSSAREDSIVLDAECWTRLI